MAPGPNPTTFRDRGGRLQAFARGHSDAQASYNAPASKHQVPEKRPATPTNAVAPVLTKKEITDDVRVPIPVSTRVENAQPVQTRYSSLPMPPLLPKAAGGASEKVELPSPPKASMPAIQTKEEIESKRELFEGSQLSEGFMDSDLTTPQNEVEDVEPNPSDEEKELMLVKATNDERRNRSTRGVSQRVFTHFQVGEDGFMTVNGGAGNRSPSRMSDGFQSGPPYSRDMMQHGVAWPPSPDRQPTALPMREVKIRRSLPATRETRQVPDQSPRKYEDLRQRAKFKQRTREPSPLGDSEEEESRPPSEPDVHMTPKATRKGRVQSWQPVESPARREESVLDSRLQGKKRHRASPDYDDMMLSSMTFAQLHKEPFDTDPAKVPQSGQGSHYDTLPRRLEHNRQRPEGEQASFFTSMPIGDWEASGDWLVDQFADLMKQMRDARRYKRNLVEQFENEAAAREEAVRARSEAIDRKLMTMAQNGRQVLGGKGA